MKYKVYLIIFMLLLIVFGLGITYSIFTSRGTLSTDQGIAKFVFEAKKMDEIELEITDLNPNEDREYNFSVSNNFESKRSDVSIEYKIVLKTYHFIPLDIKLYKLDGESMNLVFNCNETYSRNSKNELVCNSEVQEMNYKADEVDNYKIVISFIDGYDDPVYSNLVDYLNLEIQSWQKVGD